MLVGLVMVVLASGDPFLGDGHHGSLTVSARRTLSPSVPLSADANAGAHSLDLPADAGFVSGDLLLVHRTTSTTGANDRDAGAFDLSTTDLGQFEFVRLGAATASGFALQTTLSRSYPAAGSQAVLVHEFTDVTVLDAGVIVPANSWNGSAGGIVAFLVLNELTLDGTIDVSGAGFRGGAPVVDFAGNDPATFGCTDPDQALPRGAHKGEGFFSSLYGPTAAGLGRALNGGGGGDCHNSGGGAGSHVGAGGQGGASWDADGSRDVGGRGGVKLAVPDDRLTFGGAGGGGESHHGSTNNGGSNGGGVLFVRANALRGNGRLLADGASSPDVGDASGGAGAGGTVFLEIAKTATCSLAAARGGNGGINPCQCEGTSGGGGGGRVLIRADFAACVTDVTAGLGGHFDVGGTPTFRLAEPTFVNRASFSGSSQFFDGGLRVVIEAPDAGVDAGTNAGDAGTDIDAGMTMEPDDAGVTLGVRRLTVGCGCATGDFTSLLVLAVLALRRRIR
ncbi:MAG: hypothetical protein QM817_28810 [Archangium sp.]